MLRACLRACGGDLLFIISEARPNNSEEVLRLRRQLERSKESRKTMAEEHDEAVARLEQAKEVGFESKLFALFCLLAMTG